jgi:alkanesulfonate monooxygenase SsuD/methylene tetrahydromethanopterin reductase-like flavin-dependent oxidoreductase (luciferase family)
MRSKRPAEVPAIDRDGNDGLLDSTARGMGLAVQPDHDGPYDAADEYMSVVYQLWVASWEDGAVLRDKANRIFADPAKIQESASPKLCRRC